MRNKERTQRLIDLSRRFIIHMCKDGTISYRDQIAGERVFNGRALAVFSVDTVEQAQEIQAFFCRRMYQEHPQIPGRPWYVLSRLGEDSHYGLFELSDLDKVTTMFRQYWDEYIDKNNGAA